MCSRSVGADRNREDKIMKRYILALAVLGIGALPLAFLTHSFADTAMGIVYGVVTAGVLDCIFGRA